MPLEREFAEALVEGMSDAGWVATALPNGDLSNPLDITFSRQGMSRRLLIHARRITAQARSGSEPSDHNRPAGEMHTQMIFDGDQRGRGIRNHLRFAEGAQTVLLGFALTASGYVVAAYDPQQHQEYAYSKSLQLKGHKFEQALKTGLAFQERSNGETIVVFHLSEIDEYLTHADQYHNLDPAFIEEATQDADAPTVSRAFDPDLKMTNLPDLAPAERKRAVAEVERYVRDKRFSDAIRSVYDRCAICGFQYDYVLDAAHIVPVSEGGTDTYDNGLGLCPTCHRMYDKGFILVDETGKIFINTRHAEEYDQIGRAGSLENLQNTLRKTLWQPRDPQHHPAPENLRRTFLRRR